MRFLLCLLALLLIGCRTSVPTATDNARTVIVEYVTATPVPTEPVATAPPLTVELAVEVLTSEQIAEIEEVWSNHFRSVTGVVVRQGGTVVFEQYRGRQDADSLMEVYSVTKSVVALLTGIALAEGDLAGVDVPVSDLLPEYTEGLDEQKQAITVADVMLMATGLSSGWSMEGSPITTYRGDLHERALALTQVAEPGSVSRYNTLTSSLMTGILEAATGRDLEEYAAEKLFAPLGISEWEWYRDDTDRPTSGAGLKLRTADMAKIGQLVLNEGVWEGKRLLSAEFITTATSHQLDSSLWNGQTHGYGYLWWVSTSNDLPNWVASGYGGQKIVGVPSLDLVVAISTPCCIDPSAGWATRLFAENIIQPLFVEEVAECTELLGDLEELLVGDGNGEMLKSLVYLPPCYADSVESYPVLYLIHGGGLDANTWFRLGADDAANVLLSQDKIEPMIIVSPPALDFGTRFYDFFLEGLMPIVYDQYRTNGENGLAGMSLGGGLTTWIGLTNPDRFAGLGIWSMTYVGGNRDDVGEWLDALEMPPAIQLDVGEADRFVQYHEEMRDMLDARAIPYEYTVNAGDHDLDYWKFHLPTYLQWFDTVFADG